MAIQANIVFRGFEVYDGYKPSDLSELWAHFRVTLDPHAPQHMNEYPGFAQKLLAQYPRLRVHACDNGAAKSFAQELETTEVAHALEHLIVELLALETNRSRFDIKGQTAWNFSRDGQGVYRLRIKGFSSEEQARRISQQACIIFADLSR